MGILDRFTTLLNRREQSRIDPRGPLGLLPGDAVSHYDKRFTLVGTRVHMRDGRLVFQYRLRAENGDVAVLVCGGDVAEGFSLEYVRDDLAVDPSKEVQTGPEDEQFRLVDRGSCTVQHFGDTGHEDARQVAYRVFEDEETEQILTIEEYGRKREVRLGEAAFEGELRFHGNAGGEEERPWDMAADQCDVVEAEPAEDDVLRGSPLAAAMALEGRLTAGASDPTSFAEHDPTEFDDAEWADAHDVVPEIAEISEAECAFAFSESSSWLEPTQLVAGGGGRINDELEDDWLVRDDSSA